MHPFATGACTLVQVTRPSNCQICSLTEFIRPHGLDVVHLLCTAYRFRLFMEYMHQQETLQQVFTVAGGEDRSLEMKPRLAPWRTCGSTRQRDRPGIGILILQGQLSYSSAVACGMNELIPSSGCTWQSVFLQAGIGLIQDCLETVGGACTYLART